MYAGRMIFFKEILVKSIKDKAIKVCAKYDAIWFECREQYKKYELF